MYTKAVSAFSDAWSWDDRARFVFVSTIIVGMLILFFFFKKWSKKKINPPLPPGPKGLPLVGNLLSVDPELHTYFASLAKTYGPIYTLKLGKKIGIVINSPAIAKEVLKDQDKIFANRDVPAAAKVGSYGGSDITWSPYGPEWRMLRKVCVQEMLSNNTLDSVYDLRRREIWETIKYLYRRGGSPVNVGEQIFLSLMNVVTSMMWGGTVMGEKRSVVGAEFKKVVGDITGLLFVPNLSDFFPVLERFDLQGIQKKMKGLAKRFDEIFETIIDQRLEINRQVESGGGGKQSKDFLDFLLKMKDNNGDAKTPFTMTHLKALLMFLLNEWMPTCSSHPPHDSQFVRMTSKWCHDMVIGGTDTTSATVEFALAEMMNKPEILKKVQQELETVVGKDNIVEESDINKLPYLYTVMKEVLRLHSSVPLLAPHSPNTTCNVAGYTIPKGACVFVNVWAIHRDPSIWENPLDFCPDRFSDGKWDYSGNDFNYFPFGSGRRICAGLAMGERMFMFSLASLVHSFDWSLPAGETGLDLSEKFGSILKKKLPLIAIPTPRLSNPSLYD
ncbi:hypothetical protein DH2020_000498 [Rehmannia glutinosa]|uniref:Flavonoid 3'-monooxygenase-like n=1 Tax=Rehmannia glutinosa TaxID=99300 RepID=A0ABR0XX98_REHGL